MRYFLRLPYQLKRVAIVAAMMAPRIKRRLNTVGYEETVQWLNQRRQAPVADVRSSMAIARIAQAAIMRVPGSYNCLTRSVTVWWLVGGDDVARVVFGVGTEQSAAESSGPFYFHAWVEQDATVINDAPDVGTRYTRFTSPPTQSMSFD